MAFNTLNIQKNDQGEIVRIVVSLGAYFKEKNGKYIGKIKSLRLIALPGATKEAADENLRLALKIFFEVHVERKTLERALRNFGWHTTASFLDDHAELLPPEETLDVQHDVEIYEELALAG